MRIDSLPPQYRPFKEVDIGTNRAIDVEVLIAMNDNVPLLIGTGDVPRIWLSVPSDPVGQTWHPLVRDNTSLHPKVTVTTKGATVVIGTPDGVVLRVEKTSPSAAKVDLIDLRPLGINVHGDQTSLNIAMTNLKSNTFANVKVMVGIGATAKTPSKQAEPPSPP